MDVQLKSINEQVIVITGASSGIGLTTAREAARRGAKVVLVSRNGNALQQLADEIGRNGGEALAVAADVADAEAMRHVATEALRRFGRIDTWVNNAGVSTFGRLDQVAPEDHRRLFETNFWGVVNGSLAALPLLKREGGALINVGSEVSDAAIPMQGMYSASKHAVKGFTDALRVELQAENARVCVTLIKPAAIDTLFVPHAKNYMDVEPKLPPPIYAPDVVADAILAAAQSPMRDVYVGGAAKMMAAAAYWMPATMDRYRAKSGIASQRSARPADVDRPGSLFAPGLALREREPQVGHVWESSLYTRAVTRPGGAITTLLVAAAAIGATWWVARERSAWERASGAVSRFGRAWPRLLRA